MDEFDECDPVWKLLGGARRSQASPYFVRKVLRAVREDSRTDTSKSHLSVLLRWILPASACAAMALGWSVYQGQQESSLAEFNEYFDTVADLPALVEQENLSLWVDSN